MTPWRQLHTPEEVLAAVKAGDRVEFTSDYYGKARIDMPDSDQPNSGGWIVPRHVYVATRHVLANNLAAGNLYRARPLTGAINPETDDA